MLTPPVPQNEDARVTALQEYNILDTLPEQDYDDITLLASQICNVPVSLISLIDPTRQWFKSHFGLNATETPREYAFCAHAINKPDEVLVVADSRKDERFWDNPLVVDAPFVIFYTGVPLVNPDGHALGTLCVIDHEPRELNQEQIGALKALGNQVVKLLELRKKNSNLQQIQIELEKKNKDLEQFAYVVSHDIKSPLATMISIIELFKDSNSKTLDESSIQYLNIITESSEKLSSFVDSILSYYKSDNILSQSKIEINTYQLVKSIVKLLDPQGLHKITLLAENTTVFGNKSALEQIFINLISNSIKYNNKPSVEIIVKCREEAEFYCFAVEDNGRGIKEKDLERIFGLFTNLGIKDRNGNIGTGIGLSTVKKLIENQGGSISISSVPEKGTIFEFTVKK